MRRAPATHARSHALRGQPDDRLEELDIARRHLSAPVGLDVALYGETFRAVQWESVAVALALKLYSIAMRASAWRVVIRLFDVVALGGLIVFVLYTARIPTWAVPALAVFAGVGGGLLIAALLVAPRRPVPVAEHLGPHETHHAGS